MAKNNQEKTDSYDMVASQDKPVDGESSKLIDSWTEKMGVSRTTLGVLVLVVLVVGFTIGILVGVFGVNTDGRLHKLMKEADETVSHKLIAEIQAENIKTYLRNLTAKPHLAGTPADLEQAQELKAFWDEVGLDSSHIDSYNVLLSYPDKDNPNRIVMYNNTGDVIFTTQLVEKILRPEQNHSDVVPPFLAYSAPGTPKGDLIYVNYGRNEDFTWLKENKTMNFTGKIVIARYGKIYRGDKVRFAEEFGAAGLILFSDPYDYAVDGVTSVYPDSWWLPGSGVQRGSTYIPFGDPLTPGYPALDSGYRIPESEAPLARIPCHPIGYDDATVLLSNMSGDEAPQSWRGNLPITYRLGPGFIDPSWEVQMFISTDNKNATTHNVFGTITGSIEPDRYVLLGNHRDAWVFGAVDPSSGTATMMEMARAMAKLVKEGWRPRRTIMFCSWGAEEYGLIGSQEWVEHYSVVLGSRSIMYLNVDIAAQGNYSIRGSGVPTLHDVMYEVAKKIPNPDPAEVEQGRTSVFDTWVYRIPGTDREGNPTGNPRISLLGGGSDYAPFIQTLGIASADITYTYDQTLGLLSYPLYHSVYEEFHLVSEIMDPTFEFNRATARYWAEMARRFADELVIPLNVTRYPESLRGYMIDIEDSYGALMRANGMSRNLDFIHTAIDKFKVAANNFQDSRDNVDRTNPFAVRQINDQIIQIERVFIDPLGLPDRPLDRHVIFAASQLNSYAGSYFPGIHDSMFEIEKAPPAERTARWRVVEEHLSALSHFIEMAASSLENVADFME